jgi:hypothetical protein
MFIKKYFQKYDIVPYVFWAGAIGAARAPADRFSES